MQFFDDLAVCYLGIRPNVERSAEIALDALTRLGFCTPLLIYLPGDTYSVMDYDRVKDQLPHALASGTLIFGTPLEDRIQQEIESLLKIGSPTLSVGKFMFFLVYLTQTKGFTVKLLSSDLPNNKLFKC